MGVRTLTRIAAKPLPVFASGEKPKIDLLVGHRLTFL
jgi:hypothetical protein